MLIRYKEATPRRDSLFSTKVIHLSRNSNLFPNHTFPTLAYKKEFVEHL